MADKTPIAVVAADTHIDQYIWSSNPAIMGDSFFGFSQLVDMAIQEDLPLIVAGDFLECLPVDNPLSVTISFLREQLDRLRKAGVPFYMINGQHDVTVLNVPWVVAVGFRESYKDCAYVDIGGVSFGFLSHRPKRYLDDALEELEEADVFICHQVWQEIMGGRSCEGSLSQIPAKLIISGDYHKYKVVEVPNLKGYTSTVISPGATHIRKINEPAKHYALRLYDDLSHDKVELRSRMIARTDITTMSDLEILLDEGLESLQKSATDYAKKNYLPPELCSPILDLRDYSELSGIHARVTQAAGHFCHVYYRRSKVDEAEFKQDFAAAPTGGDLIAAALKYECQQANDEMAAEYGLLTELLDTEQPKVLIKSLRESLLQDYGNS